MNTSTSVAACFKFQLGRLAVKTSPIKPHHHKGKELAFKLSNQKADHADLLLSEFHGNLFNSDEVFALTMSILEYNLFQKGYVLPNDFVDQFLTKRMLPVPKHGDGAPHNSQQPVPVPALSSPLFANIGGLEESMEKRHTGPTYSQCNAQFLAQSVWSDGLAKSLLTTYTTVYSPKEFGNTWLPRSWDLMQDTFAGVLDAMQRLCVCVGVVDGDGVTEEDPVPETDLRNAVNALLLCCSVLEFETTMLCADAERFLGADTSPGSCRLMDLLHKVAEPNPLQAAVDQVLAFGLSVFVLSRGIVDSESFGKGGASLDGALWSALQRVSLLLCKLLKLVAQAMNVSESFGDVAVDVKDVVDVTATPPMEETLMQQLKLTRSTSDVYRQCTRDLLRCRAARLCKSLESVDNDQGLLDVARSVSLHDGLCKCVDLYFLVATLLDNRETTAVVRQAATKTAIKACEEARERAREAMEAQRVGSTEEGGQVEEGENRGACGHAGSPEGAKNQLPSAKTGCHAGKPITRKIHKVLSAMKADQAERQVATERTQVGKASVERTIKEMRSRGSKDVAPSPREVVIVASDDEGDGKEDVGGVENGRVDEADARGDEVTHGRGDEADVRGDVVAKKLGDVFCGERKTTSPSQTIVQTNVSKKRRYSDCGLERPGPFKSHRRVVGETPPPGFQLRRFSVQPSSKYTQDTVPMQRLPQEQVITIGRSTSCRMRLVSMNALKTASISRMHAEVRFSEEHGKHMLRDLNSANGTFVNWRKLHPRKEHTLQAGDLVVFGGSQRLQPGQYKEFKSEFSYVYEERKTG